MCSYLSNRTKWVRTKTSDNNRNNINYGVPQSSSLEQLPCDIDLKTQ